MKQWPAAADFHDRCGNGRTPTQKKRKKHECSHIKFVDVRRYCYVACRDQDEDFKNLLACKNNKVQGLIYLNMEIAAWMDSPKCGRKTCKKKRHPLGDDVDRSAGTF